ncbi:hypothetical protein E1264_28645 [Actinomadura sp. KC216]|uniref:hypothetical protein n=1 Tax=Actinomadura sp. KC216 TaxID=2530370 RepID=UPI00104E3D2F|nr:hypothetical protein [Actinomadura sp. KC216]TDB83366.1 hypothetical protein E1264_28645 [Actinomadura sp. KC216]
MAIDWSDVPAWAALALSAGSFGIATWAAVESRKSRKATQDSAEAAKRSAVAAERSHELTEQQYRDSLPPPVKLVVLALKKNRYQLANHGTETATGVTVDRNQLEGLLVLGDEPPENATIRPDCAQAFSLAPDFDHQVPNEVWVTWDGHPEPQAVPLPQ